MRLSPPVFVCLCLFIIHPLSAQTLEQQLLSESAESLAAAARETGDAQRGAILFHQVHVGCVKCHALDGTQNLGPVLYEALPPAEQSRRQRRAITDADVVTSILKPSDTIRNGFETVVVVTTDGRSQTGLLVSRTPDAVVLRDPTRDGERVALAASQIDEIVPGKVSVMPAGIVNQLGDRQQFLNLVRYVLEIRHGGLDAVRRLQPPPGLIAFRLPEYEQHVDHAGLIRKLDDDAFRRGEEIYNRLCINCHGDHDRPGSLPTALRFAEGKFRSGSDPYTMYRTLTHGFGLMVPQTWMVPTQKYDVVHYIREAYVRRRNTSQYRSVTDEYLAALPAGNTFGPDPVPYAPWSDMDYGPSMINTFEVGSDGHNFAYKGIAVRLDPGPGGVARGNQWAVFDHDTMRVAAVWTRDVNSRDAGFIDWHGIHFDGRHGTHPRIVGDLQFENPTGPGWARPDDESPSKEELFADTQRVLGRDGRRYGPLPKTWVQYRGLHSVRDQTIVEYTVGGRTVLERFGTEDFPLPLASDPSEDAHSAATVGEEQSRAVSVFLRSLTVERSDRPNLMLAATHPEQDVVTERVTSSSVLLRPADLTPRTLPASVFDGRTSLLIGDADAMDMTSADFTICARIRTEQGGTILCKTKQDGPWVPNGKTFFVRGGRLCYDIGWVGVVQSKKSVNDGKWHNVVLTWQHKDGRAAFYIDGKHSGGGVLKPKAPLDDEVARIGFSAGNFPNPSAFVGEIARVSFHNSALEPDDIAARNDETVPPDVRNGNEHSARPIAEWELTGAATNGVVAGTGSRPANAVVAQSGRPQEVTGLLTGLLSANGMSFVESDNRLCLNVPAADRVLSNVVWTARVPAACDTASLKNLVEQIEDRIRSEDLFQVIAVDSSQPKTARRWPEVMETVPQIGPNNGPFAIDELPAPFNNPWLCRIRLTGHDFYEDDDRMAVCSWDGDVWLVSGLRELNNRVPRQTDSDVPKLRWQRIASGLFQPLGLKIVDEVVYVTCRDQIVILRDRNGDGETDYYECFNNDQQVTDHFHEFAMGLQRDAAGNFYYAKSARHALTALVPHHGTLLRVTPDGSRTEILATGFRAANGVCLNPDGTFIVTDQEGHWNPKNRINYVREGGFYGNMFGYHDVTDESDDAMEQPLCWITNAFDRSPAELLWIDNPHWGPLNGTLLNLSYGYGRVYVVPHENVDGQMQGGMCELPIPQFPTGLTRGRISPHDNALYVCGMFAWGSSQQSREGGLYRIRYTGQPAYLPTSLQARDRRIAITFSDPVDSSTVDNLEDFRIKAWDLKRSEKYGSDHYNERELKVSAAELSDDQRTITLHIPDLAPTWGMEIRCRLKTPDGSTIERVIHNTIHRVK
ncbi:MAG: c-type cytochrome [Planctomycetaceae bacterium]|nr:c-type cytochrome [Planctomycetaceae bacterium]